MNAINESREQKMKIPHRTIINKDIYLFIYILIKCIIFDEDKPKKKEIKLKEKHSKKINLFIGIANDKIYQRINKISKTEQIKITAKDLTTEYTEDNFERIIEFLEQQNPVYIGDILDCILIQICGFAMQIDPYETINEIIYDNLTVNGDITVFEKDELARIRKYINVEVFKDDKLRKNLYPPFNKIVACPFLSLLLYSYKEKLEIINNQKKYNCYNIMKYFFNYFYDGITNYFIDGFSKIVNNHLSQELENINSSKLVNINYMDQFLVNGFNSINNLVDKNETKDPKFKTAISMLQYFFYTLFVYSKTIKDNLIKYNHSNDDTKNKIIGIPYSYDLESGFMNIYNSLMVISPIKLIKGIKHVSFRQNNLGDIGLFESGKALLFNRDVETFIYDKNIIRAYYIAYFIFVQRIFNNYNIKEISFNTNIYLKEDIDIILCEIIKHFKGVKIINISNNEIKSGITKFCIELKKLYRENKCKVEELNFKGCTLDDESIYELSELIKCKKCRLKTLNLDKNNLRDSVKLFECIKKNKSLVNLYVSRCQINNTMIEKKINRVISLHMNLKIFDLCKNSINSSSILTKLISRTKVIKNYMVKNDGRFYSNVKTKINNDHVHLFFLDLSQNPVNYLNKNFIDNIIKIVKDSNLQILHCQKIFFGENKNNSEKQQNNKTSNRHYNDIKSEFSEFVRKENSKDRDFDKIYSLKNNEEELKELLKRDVFNEYNKAFQNILKIEKDKSKGKNIDLEKEMNKFVEKEKNAKNKNNNTITINGEEESEGDKIDKTEILNHFSLINKNLFEVQTKIKNVEERNKKQSCILIV